MDKTAAPATLTRRRRNVDEPRPKAASPQGLAVNPLTFAIRLALYGGR